MCHAFRALRRLPCSPNVVLVCCVLLLGLVVAVLPPPSAAHSSAPRWVATYNSLGVYWKPDGGRPTVPVKVEYQAPGGAWTRGHDLWFDDRSTATSRPGGKEYRGSIVQLQAGTSYAVRLTLGANSPVSFRATTWNENFSASRILKTVEVTSLPYTIVHGGNPSQYVLYTPAPGLANQTFNVSGGAALKVQASYVIIRGFKIRGVDNSLEHGIVVNHRTNAVTDVVIENNDIQNWGIVDPTYASAQQPIQQPYRWGGEGDAAVRIVRGDAERITIQRNKLHHPYTDTNSWWECRSKNASGWNCSHPNIGFHPTGPSGIWFDNNGAGNHVVRYNEFFTDEQHYFNDAITGATNQSYAGAPNKDSDIYGNKIERVRDNAIETEGANQNVRVWGNYIDRAYAPFGTISTSVGPLYIWRNIVDRSLVSDFVFDPTKVYGLPNGAIAVDHVKNRGRVLKAASSGDFGDGRLYFYHNTLLQGLPAPGDKYTLGAQGGIRYKGDTAAPLTGVVSRNNILNVRRPGNGSSSDYSIYDNNSATNNRLQAYATKNDFDYDLYNGRIETTLPNSGLEPHGNRFTGEPGFAQSWHAMQTALNNAANSTVDVSLVPSSLGYDSGLQLPNFNDGYTATAPDVGAHEAGTPPLEFGVNAYTASH